MSAAISKALVKAQHDIKAVAKDAVNPHFKNRYASLDAIMEMVRPTLGNYGMAVTQDGQAVFDVAGAVAGVTVRTTLIHESGETISNSVTMPLEKATAQGVGSALTYGRRYGLSALLALTTDEDDDGARASERAPAQEKAAADKVMPFGKTKGKRLGDLTAAELESAIAWCRKTDAAKFADLIDAMGEVLADRAEDIPLPEGAYAKNLDALLEKDGETLPFK